MRLRRAVISRSERPISSQNSSQFHTVRVRTNGINYFKDYTVTFYEPGSQPLAPDRGRARITYDGSCPLVRRIYSAVEYLQNYPLPPSL